MNILFCTAELAPFSQEGGLAEFSAALPSELIELENELSIITPLYGSIDRRAFAIEPFASHERSHISLGTEHFEVAYHVAKYPGTEIDVFFVECDPLFAREGMYINPATGKGFVDNHRRFGLFQEAILHLVHDGYLQPDVLHLNDHHTALLAAMVAARRSHNRNLEELKTLLTIHNIAYQVDCDEELAWSMGLGDLMFGNEGSYRQDGRLNFLKAGILFADKVVAVSMTYARETLGDDGQGHGLCEELKSRKEDYVGILNGIDYSMWNPKTDELIDRNYGINTLAKRNRNKEELLINNGLDHSDLSIPTIGMISKLNAKKGMDLMTGALDKMMTFDLRLVVLGSGEPAYHKWLESIQMRYPHKMALNLTQSERKARAILAGSDFFLMPSRYEPCGQHQMYAMAYGSVPIVHSTGGLADTVTDVSEDATEGWGFTFREYDAKELLKTVWRAVSLYRKKKLFRQIVRRAMSRDYSWRTTAENYTELYKTLR